MKFVTCSLPTVVCVIVSNIVCQVALLLSYNSRATVSLLCILPTPIYLNFIEFLSEKRGCGNA